MRNLHLLDVFRDVGAELLAHGGPGDHGCGIFELPSEVDRQPMRVIASDGGGWDHVSVSRRDRCPTWTEMEQVKRAFFADHEAAMQLHVPPSDHLSLHPYCLHLWRPQDVEIPRPPAIFVAPPSAKKASAA